MRIKVFGALPSLIAWLHHLQACNSSRCLITVVEGEKKIGMSKSVEKPSKCLSLCIYAMCNDCNVWKETNRVSVLMRLFVVALDMWE